MKKSKKVITQVNKDIDEIYDSMDALMTAGCWNFLDNLFQGITPTAWRIDIDILLAYATASLPAKSKIPSRKMFMDKCIELHSDPELWKGLT